MRCLHAYGYDTAHGYIVRSSKRLTRQTEIQLHARRRQAKNRIARLLINM